MCLERSASLYPNPYSWQTITFSSVLDLKFCLLFSSLNWILKWCFPIHSKILFQSLIIILDFIFTFLFALRRQEPDLLLYLALPNTQKVLNY